MDFKAMLHRLMEIATMNFRRPDKPAVPSVSDIVGSTRKAICVGLNYAGTPHQLKGCVNDAIAWQTLLKDMGYSVVLLRDGLTKRQLINELTILCKQARPGDSLVWTYSGHGTTTDDEDGDEDDYLDEALYVGPNQLLVDDEIRSILAMAPNGVRICVVLDSCHSGTCTRDAVPRFVPGGKARKRKTTSRLGAPHPEVPMDECLIAGCMSDQESYDGHDESGKPMGAFSAAAMKVISVNGTDITYAQFYQLIKAELPSDIYPQDPQVEGRPEVLSMKMFK